MKSIVSKLLKRAKFALFFDKNEIDFPAGEFNELWLKSVNVLPYLDQNSFAVFSLSYVIYLQINQNAGEEGEFSPTVGLRL